jgi:altronate dehydratase large subunit
MKFHGFSRKDGTFGARNHLLVFPTVQCANHVAEKISLALPGSVSVAHPHGCGHMGEDKEHIIRSMSGFCANPNVGGVLLVGLGCELIAPELIAAELRKRGQEYEILLIQDEGGTLKSIGKGCKLGARLLKGLAGQKRVQADISQLVLGVKCGGSDSLSGLSANPALGIASDRLVGSGGTVLLSEVPEMLGAEEVLARRAATPAVRRRIYQITSETEAAILEMGVDVRGSEPSPGNIAGGLTTLEEKSLGAVLKGGSSPIRQVVRFGEKPRRKGLVIMDGPALDAVCLTGFSACGAQIAVFTTGRGSPLGSAIMPVIKVSSNSQIFRRMRGDMDIDAGTILNGTDSLASKGEEIWQMVSAVASGKITASERLGHREFAVHTIGPTL